VAAGGEQTSAAVRTLLREALVTASTADGPALDLDGRGELLRRIVLNGHGTDFPDGRLAAAHAQFLIGLEHHIGGRSRAHRAYLLAALEYRGEERETLARLAELACETVAEAAHTDAIFAAVEEQVGALAEVDGAVSDRLATPLDGYLASVAWIVAAGAGAEVPEPPGDGPERAALLRNAVSAHVAEPAVAIRLVVAEVRVHGRHQIEPHFRVPTRPS